MAIFKGKFLIGSIGNLTFKKNRKNQVLQTKPGKGRVKQTTATKKAALVFGKASALSNCIRSNFRQLTGSDYDGEMINRLNKENFAILKQCYQPETESYEFKTDSFRRLNGFDFNNKSQLKDSLWVDPTVQLSEKELLIQLPEFKIPADFKFPAYSHICSLKLSVYIFSIKTGVDHQLSQEPLQISYEQEMVPAREWKVQIPDGCICVTGIALHFYRTQGDLTIPVNHKEFNPVAILNTTVSKGTYDLPWDVDWQFSGLSFEPKEKPNTPNDDLSNLETKSE